MIRILYSPLLQLHPRAFRERFSDEMLCIFDEVPSTREGTFLFYDASRSFAFRCLFRSNLWIFALAFFIALIQAYIALHPYRGRPRSFACR
jgi:hypothetical protein